MSNLKIDFFYFYITNIRLDSSLNHRARCSHRTHSSRNLLPSAPPRPHTSLSMSASASANALTPAVSAMTISSPKIIGYVAIEVEEGTIKVPVLKDWSVNLCGTTIPFTTMCEFVHSKHQHFTTLREWQSVVCAVAILTGKVCTINVSVRKKEKLGTASLQTGQDSNMVYTAGGNTIPVSGTVAGCFSNFVAELPARMNVVMLMTHLVEVEAHQLMLEQCPQPPIALGGDGELTPVKVNYLGNHQTMTSGQITRDPCFIYVYDEDTERWVICPTRFWQTGGITVYQDMFRKGRDPETVYVHADIPGDEKCGTIYLLSSGLLEYHASGKRSPIGSAKTIDHARQRAISTIKSLVSTGKITNDAVVKLMPTSLRSKHAHLFASETKALVPVTGASLPTIDIQNVEEVN